MENGWGLSCNVDVFNCDPSIIRSAAEIQNYVIALCKLIDMKRFEDCKIVRFGEDENVAGFSMVQLIETSLISGHFVDKTNAAYIDIFSCKSFDPEVVVNFTKEFFKTDEVNVSYRWR